MRWLANCLLQRVRAAWVVPPAAAWAETAAWLAAFALVFAMPARASGLMLEPALWGGPWWLTLRVLLVPAAAEELFFRVAANPHPGEGASPRQVRWAGIASVGVYVVSHLGTAWLRPEMRAAFLDPVFLAAVTVLGVGTWILYRRWGSLFPPTLLHAGVVNAWLYAGGAALLT